MAVNVVNIFEAGDYDAQVARAADLLKQGGIVVLPTETVYGAAGLLNHERGVSRLRDLRSNGNGGKPFTVHLASRDAAGQYLDKDVSELGRRMMKKLWPGPVAITFAVAPGRRKQVAAEQQVAEGDLYNGETITLRCPDHVLAAEVLGQVNGPVALTLVEAFPVADGRMSFTALDEKVDLAFDAGPSRFSKPSTIVRVKGDHWEIVRAGIYDQRIIERLLRTTVLFVCSGNTCRSPMAEALARRVIAEHLKVAEDQIENKGFIVTSSGSFALPGARATPQAVEAVKALGADLSKHRSRPLSVELIHQADFIFTMGRAHTQAVLGLVPSAADRTATLDPAGDVEDPIGGDASLYNELAQSLLGLIEKRLRERVLK